MDTAKPSQKIAKIAPAKDSPAANAFAKKTPPNRPKNDLAFRIIPCLDIKNGRVVKGVNFLDLQDVGDPVACAAKYSQEGADEIVFLDISATHEERKILIETVRAVARAIFIPFTVGGGIRDLGDIYSLLDSGCDKISLNSAAIKNPTLIEEAAKRFGSQCVVVAIDVKKVGGVAPQAMKSAPKNVPNAAEDAPQNTPQNAPHAPQKWSVFINGGRIDTKKDYFAWLKEVESRGAGEILLTSMDKDGTKDGYDLELLGRSSVKIPIIASGGAGTMAHIRDAALSGADAALAASIFHYREIGIGDLKRYLRENGVSVRV